MTTVGVVEAKITADASQFDRAMGRVRSSLGGIGTAAVQAGKVASAAIAGSAAAAAVKGVTAFSGFESGMQEVFTLLPGASEQAFAAMEADVKDFSREFGVMTEDAIPALYQALSAGVPPDNVFEFLETAQMAALGGVTDLETAVDGISSVVNAYGAEVMSATEASDLMFTAVRLGKTDFGQLSSSLFQVAPIASSMGVGFDQVTAALAALTAKGVPTSVAATQIKGAISELGKEGTKASDAFKEIAGTTFTDFIASGGDIGEAFNMMAGAADAAGASVLDSFGSIEAGQAVLALTAGGGEQFAAALDEMAASSGATEQAFETMDQGIGRSFDRIKAGINVLLIEIGEKLAPYIETAINWIVENFDTFKETAVEVGETATTVFGHIVDAVEPVVDLIIDLADEIADFLGPAIEELTEFAEELTDAFMADGVGGAADYVLEKLRPVGDWMRRNKPIIAAMATVLGSVLVVKLYAVAAGYLAKAAAATAAAAAMAAANAPIIAVIAGLAALAAAVVYAYENFDWFRTTVDAVIEGAKTAFGWFMDDAVPVLEDFAQAVWDVTGDVFQFFQDLYNDLSTVFGDVYDAVSDITGDVFGFFEDMYNDLKPIFDFVFGLYVDLYMKLWDAKEEIWSVITTITGFFGDLWDGIKGYIGDIIDDIQGMIDFIIDIPEKIGDLATSVKDKFVEVGSAILDGIADGIGAATDFVGDFARGVGNGIIGFINRNVIDKINGFLPNDLGWGPFSVDLPDNPLSHIPMLAEGGIVTKPTLAMIGEGGESEAVIPLSKLGNFGGNSSQTFNVTVNMPSGSNGDDVVRALQDYARRRGSIPVPVGSARF